MERQTINSVILNDDDIECKRDSLTLTEMAMCDTNFTEEQLRSVDLVVYSGRRGTKILKSKFFKKGKIG